MTKDEHAKRIIEKPLNEKKNLLFLAKKNNGPRNSHHFRDSCMRRCSLGVQHSWEGGDYSNSNAVAASITGQNRTARREAESA